MSFCLEGEGNRELNRDKRTFSVRKKKAEKKKTLSDNKNKPD